MLSQTVMVPELVGIAIYYWEKSKLNIYAAKNVIMTR